MRIVTFFISLFLCFCKRKKELTTNSFNRNDYEIFDEPSIEEIKSNICFAFKKEMGVIIICFYMQYFICRYQLKTFCSWHCNLIKTYAFTFNLLQQHLKLLSRFVEANERHVPYLLRKAERIEEYMQQR